MTPLLELRREGLFCPQGGFFIDPMRPVERAVVTHGHGDHASPGHRSYLCSRPSVPILEARLGKAISIEGLEWGEQRDLGGVRISLHPAGHIPGSAQVRLEAGGEVWVVTGDYKTEPDGVVEPFELVPCHTLITETTFGLPIYRWCPQEEVFAEINRWWLACQSRRQTAVLLGYSLGKAQRLIGSVDHSIGPVAAHASVEAMSRACRAGGAKVPGCRSLEDLTPAERSRALFVAPPGSEAAQVIQSLGEPAIGYASGWMAVGRQRRSLNGRGFVLSDHVDWPSLMAVVKASGAERVFTTHGYEAQVARWLTERGLDSRPLSALAAGAANA